MDVLIKLDGVVDVDAIAGQAGGKAAGLARLQSISLDVPETHALPAGILEDFARSNGIDLEGESSVVQSAIRSSPLHPELIAALAELDSGFWAVRSSALAEDGRNQSYAGLFESVLNVNGEAELHDAIRHCWASAFSDRIHDYEAHEKVSPKDGSRRGIGLVIQKMVDADFGGVAFSIDAVSGDDRLIMIEAVAGLGSDLVNGRVTPRRYLVDRFSMERRDQGSDDLPGPSREIIHEIAGAAVMAQAKFGYPVDIEWAAEGERVRYVQLRPVTSAGSTFVEGQWTTADFRDGGISAGVCTPMMWALYGAVLQQSMQSYLKEVGMLKSGDERRWGLMAYGRPYWNVGAVKRCLLQLPGFNEQRFDDDLGVGRSYEGQGRVSKMTLSTILNGGRIYSCLQRRFKRALAGQEGLFSEVRRRVDTAHAIDYQTLTHSELRVTLRKLVEEEHRFVEGIYFKSIYDASNYHTLFKEKWHKRIGETDYLNLIGGLENLSHTRLATDIETFALAIAEDPVRAGVWRNATPADLLNGNPGQLGVHLANLIAGHGYRGGRELDLMEPRYSECPENLVALIQAAIPGASASTVSREADSVSRREQAMKRVCERLSSRQFRALLRQLAVMRRFLWWKEEFRDQSTRLYAEIRRAACALGAQLVAKDLLDDPSHVFFALPSEIYGDLSESADRKAFRKTVAGRRNYYLGFRNFNNPNELLNRAQSGEPINRETHDHSKALNGVGCSAGTCEGSVRILNHPAEGHRLQSGDILVARFTDPAWTPLFRHAKGIITETGGILSHAAVIAREYGIPAVLAVENATNLLSDGEKVGIDGTLGLVTRVEADLGHQVGGNSTS